MEAGTLDKRIVIEYKTSTQDALGQPIDIWATKATLWANVRFQNGKEYINSSREINSISVSFRVRTRLDLAPNMRIVYLGVNYDIEAILIDKVYMDIVAVNNG